VALMLTRPTARLKQKKRIRCTYPLESHAIKPLPYPSCYVVLAGAAAEGVRALRVVVSIRRGIDCRHVFC
jgi:hypothetical protein